MSSLLLLLLLCLAAAILVFYLNKKSWRRMRLPPGPRRLPVIGNLHQLGPLPHRSLRRLSETHGPLMLLQLGHVPTLVVSSPAGARDVLKTHDLALCSRPRLTAWQKLSYGGLDLAFAPYSDHWVRMRKLAAVEFFSAKRTLLLRPTREEEVRILVENINRTASAQHGGAAAVNLSEMFLCLLSNVTCRALFGNRYAPEGECARSVLAGMISESIELMGGFVAGDFFPSMKYWLNAITGVQRKLDKNFKEIDEFLEREVEEKARKKTGGDRRDEGDAADFASVLARLLEDESTGLTRDAMKAILMVVFIAGADTAAASLVWIMTELMRNPRVMAKAQEEVRRFARGKGEDYFIQEEDLHHFRYLSSVVKETLRLHPPGPMLLPRESREDVQMAGYDIPAGTRIYINAWAIGRDPDTWERAEEFVPERFAEEKISVDYKGQSFELVPFGGGRRMCPGIAMAAATMELTIANLLVKFRWELPDGMGRDDIDLGEAFGIVVHKKMPLVLMATPTPTPDDANN